MGNVVQFPGVTPSKLDFERIRSTYSVRDISRRFGISERYIRRWAREGLIPGASFPDGREVRFDLHGLRQFRRVRELRSANTLSQAELDSAEAVLKQNQANADAIGATIAKKTLRAPFAGRLGIRLVNLGEYLDTGKPIVSLQSLSPVHADFSLPQQERQVGRYSLLFVRSLRVRTHNVVSARS